MSSMPASTFLAARNHLKLSIAALSRLAVSRKSAVLPSLAIAFEEMLTTRVTHKLFRINDGYQPVNLNGTFRRQTRTPYSLRHTYATFELLRNSTDIHTLSKQMGNSAATTRLNEIEAQQKALKIGLKKEENKKNIAYQRFIVISTVVMMAGCGTAEVSKKTDDT